MGATKNLVFEIGTEELPSAALVKATEATRGLVEEGLTAAHLQFGSVECKGTPRRIATFVKDLALETEPVEQHFRGPALAGAYDADGNPTKAALGFARGKGVDAAQLVVREQDGKSYVWVDVCTPARPAAQVVREVLQAAAEKVNDKLTGLRTQRWGTHSCRFSRPVRWLLCLFGDEVVPVEFCDLVAGNTTRGHRLMNPGTYEVPSADAYEQTLEGVHVVVDPARRDQLIRAGIAEVAAAQGLVADTPKKTYDEVVNLVEWPTVVEASFDEEFLAVPHEIICESMLSNQRYFPLYDASGELTNKFLLVSNGDPARSDVIAAGNERVVRARLSDAKFFYEEDLKQPLEAYVAKLATVGFQEKLGTMLAKTERIEALAGAIAAAAGLTDQQAANAARAARLAKADLVTGAVVEFTSQQGVMGGYYATAAGEDPSVALAVAQHYRPRFAGDALPDETVGRVVAMADKLDTVCGIFAINEAPTGSSDPYAVRRAAIGIINIVRVEPRIQLGGAVAAALDGLAGQGVAFDRAAVEAAVRAFFVGRLAAMAKDEGVSPDTVEAVRAVDVLEPVEFLARAHALEDARTGSPEVFDDLAAAFTRANNLRDASLGTEVDAALLGEREAELLAAVDAASARVAGELSREGGYPAAIEALASLRAPIDAFFDDVMVMDEDLAVRANRLRLLNRFVAAFTDVADIGKMEKRA
jgi:glycyl-tRNA synthetase beta chain